MRHHKIPFVLGLSSLVGLTGCGSLGFDNTPTVTQATRLNVAMAAEQSGDTQMALQLYAAAVAKNPSDTNAVVLYARALVNARRIGLARELLQRQLDTQAGQPALSRELATIDVLQGQPAQALPLFDVALARDPSDVRALVNKAIALDMLGNHLEAQALYRKADSLTPDDPAIRNNMAMSLALSGRAAEASQVMQNVAEGPVAVPRIRNNMAVLAATNGDMARARQLSNGEITEAELRALSQQMRNRETVMPATPVSAVPAAMPVAAVPAPAAPVASAPVVPAPAPETPAVIQPASAPMPLAVPGADATPRGPAGEKIAPARVTPPASAPSRNNMTMQRRRLIETVERAAERELVDGAVALAAPLPVSPPVPVAAAPAVERPVGSPAVIPAVASGGMRVRVANMSAETEARPSRRVSPVMGYGVQLGALNSENMAQYAWKQMSARMPSLFDGREGSVAHMVRGSDGREFWRLITFGFSDRQSAQSFCDEVKAQGGDCSLTRS